MILSPWGAFTFRNLDDDGQAEKCHIAGGSVAWGGLFATFPLGTVHRHGRAWTGVGV